jgi:hypothetical protein
MIGSLDPDVQEVAKLVVTNDEHLAGKKKNGNQEVQKTEAGAAPTESLSGPVSGIRKAPQKPRLSY